VRREAHAGAATLHVTAPVRAQVFIDGLPVGFTPLDVPNLAASTKLVMVWAEGFESRTERVALANHETVHLHFPLERQR
jgi:CRISPR/Cas system-associated exonuclease Cas4 (RecB family)